MNMDASQIRNNVDRNINIEVISEIQKELETCDIISMVFLLYEAPNTALERLTILQRIGKNSSRINFNLLNDWVVYSYVKALWKFEFLEALMTCQLYRVVRKLGFDVQSVKRYFLYQESYIDPLKKELYILCENTTSHDLQALKLTLLSFNIDTTECETFELVLLTLMSKGFITLPKNNGSHNHCSIEKLCEILDLNTNLKGFGSSLRDIEKKYSGTENSSKKNETSTPSSGDNKKYAQDFKDVFQMFEDLNMDESSFENIQSDAHHANAYAIKDPKAVGVCYIINQEKFYPSQQSIKDKTDPLQERFGSTNDKITLERTMSALNFEVISHDNLNKADMVKNIKHVIKNNVKKHHSIFILCIMSHGLNGQIFAADTVKVRVNYIQSLLYSSDAINLRGMPKILILQACRVGNQQEQLQLMADSPNANSYFMKKSDFFTFWATAPEYEAYRCPKRGSIFIQVFCRVILKYAKYLSFIEMCLKVNDMVKQICTGLECDQLPEITFTVNKNIFLHAGS